MELNTLPDGYDEAKLGPQKRKTEFNSKEAKLAYDADLLVTKSKDSLQASGAEVPSKDQILMATESIVGSHRKDYNEALIRAINAKLDNEEQQAALQQAQSREGSRSQYKAFIDGLKLSEIETAKLKEMMSEANYVNAVETAKEMKASRIPTYEQIVTELMTFTPERLKDICEIMEKPKLQIVSDQNFDGNIAAMDENKHYISRNGDPQGDAYVYRDSDSPYKNLKKPAKVKVSIVDGIVHPKQLTGISTRRPGERRDHLTARFAAKNMRHIGENEMATLLQQSLREAQAAHNNSLIVENWEDGEGRTATFINPEGLTESTRVAYAVFASSYNGGVAFDAFGPYDENDFSCGRASVQVLEI